MSKEAQILQYDMFTGQPVDNRTPTQKKRDQEINAPQQIQMFKTPEIVQLGMKKKTLYSEWMQKAPPPPLVLHQVVERPPPFLPYRLPTPYLKSPIRYGIW